MELQLFFVMVYHIINRIYGYLNSIYDVLLHKLVKKDEHQFSIQIIHEWIFKENYYLQLNIIVKINYSTITEVFIHI